ncbi:MAG: flagellar basal body P-ring formation protein FlgA [bacterium]|nr:flagellar basal body P-ring formation protein FlgA [bacterium]
MNSSIYKLRARWFRDEFVYPLILTFAMTGFLPNLVHALSLEPQLHEKVTVKGQLVTLADLFDHAGLNGHTSLFRSPDPGTTGHISVQRILSAARKHGLNILHRPAFSKVTISRSSRKIELDVLKDMIRNRLEEKHSTTNEMSKLVININNKTKDLHLDETLQGELALASLDWSSRSRRFTARFSLSGREPVVITGTADLMIEVSVAKRNIAKGITLRRGDLELKPVRSVNRRAPRYSSIEDMIGMSTKRSLQAGKPVNINDLEAPRLILKNQLVTILLEAPGLIIRAEGKALANASRGEAVKVLNTQSKRIIHATAEASGLVSVSLKKSVASGS